MGEKMDIQPILPGVWRLQGFVTANRYPELRASVQSICQVAKPRHMMTTRGFSMRVATTSCGTVGWVSDRSGYRYSETDPETGRRWPAMPGVFLEVAQEAARMCEYTDFQPDTCLMNRYEPGVQMGAHQDKDERDFNHPVVSVSLGIPARFYIIGEKRTGQSTPIDLADGDVVVFGGVARKHYHGVRKLKPAVHESWGAVRWNLTFRKAL